jgi:hypothetical protein
MIVDTLIALRIMYLLVLPFRKWPAHRQKIIDEDGNLIDSKKKSSDWTMLHKMVAKLKRFIQLAPGGKSVIASLIGAYMLVKEQCESDTECVNLEERYSEIMKSLTEEDIQQYTPLLEEVSSNVSIAAGTAPDAEGNVEPLVRRTKNKYTDRNMKGTNIVRRNSLPSFKAFINGE